MADARTAHISGSLQIDATPELVFDVVADERKKPRRLRSSTRMPWMEIDGDVTLEPAAGGVTRLSWSWNLRPRGWLAHLSPVVGRLGWLQERRTWAALKGFVEERNSTRTGEREDHAPLPPRVAWAAVARCAATSAGLLVRREVHLPRENVGLRIRFGDGTTGRVYRETVVEHPPQTERCVLVVSFRLRAIRGAGHRAFEAESLLNTPLFVGFPGFVSKLWLSADTRGSYRGLYEWDDPRQAEAYARALWRVLALVSVPGSIHYRVVPGLRRNEVLADPARLDGVSPDRTEAWWRVIGTD